MQKRNGGAPLLGMAPLRFCKINRCTNMAADGELVLRFAKQHLHRRSDVVDRCRRALISLGWQPEAS